MRRAPIAILPFSILAALAASVGACGVTTAHPAPLSECKAGDPCNNQPGGTLTSSGDGGSDAGADAAADAGGDAAPLDAAKD
jgi:hypothetical protein